MQHGWVLLLMAGTLATGGCGQSEEERLREELATTQEQLAEAQAALSRAAQEAPASLDAAVDQFAQAFGQMGETVETLAAQDLKAMLPEKIAGLTRKSASASRNGAFGFTVSSAEAVYAADTRASGPPPQITLTINDIGSMQGMARVGLSWLNMEVDEEDENGFNRTTRYKGHKSIENFRASGASSQGEKTVFVGGRFLVEAVGENVPFEAIESVVAAVPIDRLEALLATP